MEWRKRLIEAIKLRLKWKLLGFVVASVIIWIIWAVYYYLEVNYYITFISLTLMFATLLVVYRLQKWLYQYLTKPQSSP